MQLNAKTTALVLIDLQKASWPGRFSPRCEHRLCAIEGARIPPRAAGGPIVWVRVSFASISGCAARKGRSAERHGVPAGRWDSFLKPCPIRCDGHQRQWGAFYGTDLDLQLRVGG